MTQGHRLISFVCLGTLTLIIRRPARAPLVSAKSDITAAQEPVGAIRTTSSPPASPLILRLASITQQTPDAKTLRFIVPDARKLNARPGQFLTFSFLFDGKRSADSYSDLFPLRRSGYVEITPKRVTAACRCS
jgi:hypothetical protein